MSIGVTSYDCYYVGSDILMDADKTLEEKLEGYNNVQGALLALGRYSVNGQFVEHV